MVAVNCGSAFQQMFERDSLGIAQEGYYHNGLDPRLPVDGNKGRMDSRFSAWNDASASVSCIYRDQSSYAMPAWRLVCSVYVPDLAIFLDGPVETNALGCIPHDNLVEIVHLGMAGLNPPQAPLHFIGVF